MLRPCYPRNTVPKVSGNTGLGLPGWCFSIGGDYEANCASLPGNSGSIAFLPSLVSTAASSTDSKVCGLLRDPVCINALLLRCIDKVESKKLPLSDRVKRRGSYRCRSMVGTCKRSRRVAGKAARVERFGLSRPAALALPSRVRGLVEFSHLPSFAHSNRRSHAPAVQHGKFTR